MKTIFLFLITLLMISCQAQEQLLAPGDYYLTSSVTVDGKEVVANTMSVSISKYVQTAYSREAIMSSAEMIGSIRFEDNKIFFENMEYKYNRTLNVFYYSATENVQCVYRFYKR